MDTIARYFAAERAESLFFIAVGLIAATVGAVLLARRRTRFGVGLAVPLLAIAAIQLVVGTTVYLRSRHDIARVQQALQTSRAQMVAAESPRMQQVVRDLGVYRWVEIGLLLAGAALFAIGASASAWRGVGLGLALQSGLMLVLDFYAERRADGYLRWLSAGS